MFFPHLSQIQVQRFEPTEMDSERERRRFSEFIERAARIIVFREIRVLADSDKKAELINKTKKINSLLISREKCLPFLKRWNFWRSFYLNAEPIDVKSKSQITSIFKILNLCEETKINFDLMIACVHKAYAQRAVRPGFQNCVGQGIDLYDKFKELVEEDIERMDYEERARS